MSKLRLLLHICCAPCSTSVIERLRKNFSVTAIFYNPNIYPKEEYLKRLSEAKIYVEKVGIDLLILNYDDKLWFEKMSGYENEKEGGERCVKCFKMRLEKVALEAQSRKFDFFTSTLSVSPHKNFETINKIGQDLTKKCGIKFLDDDFKKKDGFKRSLELSREHGLYRQNYCGCIYSKLKI